MWTNTSYGLNWQDNLQLFCFWNLQQLQQGLSSVLLSSTHVEKILEIQDWGEKFVEIGEIGMI